MSGLHFGVCDAEFRTLVDTLAGVEVRNFVGFPVKLRALRDTHPLDAQIVADATVLDRDSGSPIVIQMYFRVVLPRLDSAKVLWAVRKLLRQVASHEIDEAIHYQGVRVFDPHKADSC